MKSNPKYILSLMIFLPAINALSQTPLNQDVQVVREYTPTVMDVNKVEQMPTLDDTTTYRPTFKYIILSKPFETTQGIEPITPARLAADKKAHLTNSVAKFGLGTFNSLMGQFNYNILRSKLYALGLEVDHQTALGSLELEDGSSSKAPFHDTYAGIQFKRFFDKVTLTTNLGYQHNLFDYYGYRTLSADTLYEVDGQTDPVLGQKLLPNRHQRFGKFDFGLSLQNTDTSESSTHWNASVAYGSFGNKTGVHQNKFGLNGKASFPLSDFKLDIDADIVAYNLSTPNSDSLLYIFTKSQKTVMSLSPRLIMPFEGGDVQAGLLVVTEFSSEEDQMKVAPHLTASLRIADGIVTVYGGMKGQFFDNDYATVAYENPYFSPDLSVKSSFHGIDLHAGLKGSFSPNVAFYGRVDYSFFNDEHFFVNRNWQRYSTLTPMPTVYDTHNLFGVVYDDGKLLKVSGELFINPSSDLTVRAFANYYGWQLENELKAWQKPEMEMGISSSYKINKSLLAQASINYLGERYAKTTDLNNLKTLPGYFDVNASVDYKFARNWNLWGKVNNLAAGDYVRWNGYPSYKVMLMLGATYNF